jgi:hypothetical protein
VVTPVAADVPDAEALFKEARRRRFNRRIAASLVIIGVAGAVSLYSATRRTATDPPPVAVNAQAFAQSAVATTQSAKGARVSLTLQERQRTAGVCGAGGNPPVTVGDGEIDFATSTEAFTETQRACGAKAPVFCSFPQSVIETASARYTSAAYRGTTCFKASQASREQVIYGPEVAKPWVESSANPSPEYVGNEGGVDEQLFSERPLAVLRALTGQVTRVGDAEVDGVAATKYTGSATLAAIHLVEGYDPVLTRSQGTLVPAASQIRVGESIWLDGRGRVVQITTSEPIFTAVQASGSSEEGVDQVFSTMVANGGHLFQWEHSLATIDFSHFGALVDITVPPASKVSHPA